MRKFVIIAILLLLQFALPSCVKVTVTDPYKGTNELQLQFENLPLDNVQDNVYVAMSRTVNTWHYTLAIPVNTSGDSELDVQIDGKGESDDNNSGDGGESGETGDSGDTGDTADGGETGDGGEDGTEEDTPEEEEPPVVKVKPKYKSGEYHAVAFATSSPEKYRLTNWASFEFEDDKKEKWDGVVGLKDLYADILPLDKQDEEDDFFESLYDTQSTIPVIPEADHSWLGSTQKVLQSNNVESMAFSMQDVTQEIKLTLSIVNKSPEIANIGRVAVAIVGAPSRIYLLDRTVSGQNVGRVIVELTQSSKQRELDTDGKEVDRYSFIGHVRTLGLMNPINSTDLYKYGVLKVAIEMDNAKKTRMWPSINLSRMLEENPSLVQVDVTDTYRIAESTVELDIAKFCTISVEVSIAQAEGEESSATGIWQMDENLDNDNGEIPVIPEEDY